MNFGILLFQKVEELDFVGPWELLGIWKRFAQGPEQRVIVSQSLAPITCANGLSANPHISFDQCPQLDFLLVPGGEGTRTEINNPTLINFISSQARGCQAVLSVCTGSFLLHRAGLLSGKRATTHWASLDRLRAFGDVTVVEERFVRDGNIWSASGVSAGIDLILEFIASVAGEEAAAKVQLRAEYYPSGKVYGEQCVEIPSYARSAVHRKSGCPAQDKPRLR
jgi:transcriptional regulator GlxA family with amidase domain